jgi:hypothetical protein
MVFIGPFLFTRGTRLFVTSLVIDLNADDDEIVLRIWTPLPEKMTRHHRQL